MATERERRLNDATRRLLIRDNYDAHFATLEQRVMVEDRLFLARWDALLDYLHIDPTTLLPQCQPQRRNVTRGIIYTRVAHAEYLSTEPARTGSQLIVFRDDHGASWARLAHEWDDGRYECVR